MSTEQNKASFRRFIEEAYNQGNLAVLDEIASPDLVLHFVPPGTPPGPAPVKQAIASYRKAFPDLQVTVEDLIAEGDRTVARLTMSGTHRGPHMNHLRAVMSPTGKSFRVEIIDIWRLDAHGRWVECWSGFDRLGMLQQLGALPENGVGPSEAAPSTVAASMAEVNHGTSRR